MKQKKSDKFFLMFIAPALIVTCFVHVIPILSSFYISMTNLNMYNLQKFFTASFIGFANYFNVLTKNNNFIISFRNIAFFSLIVISSSIIIATLVSLFLNQKFPGKTITIAIVLIPYFTMDSVAYGLWSNYFSNDYNIGPVNTFLLNLNLINKPIFWKIGNVAMVPIIIATIWKSWPLLCIILLAGLQGIPKDLYEAGMIDGADGLRRFFKITLPLLMPYIQTVAILSLIWSIHSYNNFLVMYGASISSKTIIPSIAIMGELTVGFNYGIASAMAVILLIIVLVITLIMILRRKDENAL
jgi:multiple sugar transport system permease protein